MKKYLGNVIKPKKNSFIDVHPNKLEEFKKLPKHKDNDILGILRDKKEYIGSSLSRKKDLSTQFKNSRDLIGLPLREKIDEINTALHKRKSAIGHLIQQHEEQILKNGHVHPSTDFKKRASDAIAAARKKLQISASISASISLGKPEKPVCKSGKSYCFLGYCSCKEINLPFPTCVFSDIISFGKVILTLPLYCKWIDPKHK